MKKLGKLSISPEKIMKNEELINLHGGYDPCGGGTSWLCVMLACYECPAQYGIACGETDPAPQLYAQGYVSVECNQL